MKNEKNILPLKKNSKVAVIGEFAAKARYQGAGSSVVNCTRLEHTMDVIGNFPLDVVGYEPGYPRNGKGDPEMIRRAADLAKRADYALVYIGLDEISESEGLDRAHMRLPAAQLRLLKEVRRANKNVIVVLSAGSVVEMPWAGCCRAIVNAYLCGQAGASAVLKVITGEVNPSGKLSESWPVRYEDVPTAPYFPAKQRTVEYREGLYIGYRYYESAKVPVRYPFGFGLSYTTYVYSNLEAHKDRVTFTLTNTGERDGAEIAQVYVHAKTPQIYRPVKELKGFAKVFLRAGESREVTIPLDDKAYRYYNTCTGQFEIDGGEYEIQVGASVSDIRLGACVSVEGTEAQLPCGIGELPSYKDADILHVTDAEFEKLLGHPIPDGRWRRPLQMNDALCQLEYAKSFKARLLWKILDRKQKEVIRSGRTDLSIIFVYNMPFRAMGKLTGGMISQEMCESILTIVNGHGLSFLRGTAGLIAGGIRQRRRNRHAEKL